MLTCMLKEANICDTLVLQQNLYNAFKSTITETRQALVASGIMGLKEKQIIESGESFRVKRELVQTLKLHYNSKDIVNFVSTFASLSYLQLGIDLVKEASRMKMQAKLNVWFDDSF